MDPLVEGAWDANKDKSILIELHSGAGGDPFYSNNMGQRLNNYKKVYGNKWQGYPTLFVDGPTEPPWVYTVANVSALINTRHAVATPLTISLSGQSGGNPLNISYSANILSESAISSSDLRFILFVVESQIEFNAPNGATLHNHVVRDIIPAFDGVAIDFTNASDLSETVAGSVDIDQSWNTDNIEFVGIVQDLSTMEVYQATSMTYTYLDITKVENSIVPDNFKIENVYPNPFNPSVNILLNVKDNSPISLSVYNILGDEVAIIIKDEAFEPGNYTYEWNAGYLPTGTYFFKLNSSAGTNIKKAILLK